MRRSFGVTGGGGGGMGGDGGGGGGGDRLRGVRRVIKAGVGSAGTGQEQFSHSIAGAGAGVKTSTITTTKGNFVEKSKSCRGLISVSSSSACSTVCASPFSILTQSTFPYYTDDEPDLECFDDYIIEPVPSSDEVHHAVTALQQVLEPGYFADFAKDHLGYSSSEDSSDELTSFITGFKHEVSSGGSVSDWIEPSLHMCNSKLLQPYGSDRVCDAFHLLQTDPSIQRMVISLSSDKAVWDAVLNNEVVQEIRDSLKQADSGLPESDDEGSDMSGRSDATIDIIGWIIVNTKEKMMEIIDKILELVNGCFQREKASEGETDPFNEKLKTSFYLSIVVLLIVVVSRTRHA